MFPDDTYKLPIEVNKHKEGNKNMILYKIQCIVNNIQLLISYFEND